jgi:HSP20 family protein
VARRRDIERLQSEVEELFSDLWQLPRFMAAKAGFRPAVDCYRSTRRGEFVVSVELPGVDPDQLTVAVEGRELLIAGERRREREEGRVYQLMEIEDGLFERRIPLAPDIDAAHGNATYERGQLKVVFPIAQRRRRAGTVRIQVRRL